VEVVADECFGYKATDKLSCSGNGKCIGQNSCQCRPNYIGLACSEAVVRNVVLDDLLDQFKAQVEILVSTERLKENDLRQDLESANATKLKLDDVEKKLADQFSIMNEEIKVLDLIISKTSNLTDVAKRTQVQDLLNKLKGNIMKDQSLTFDQLTAARFNVATQLGVVQAKQVAYLQNPAYTNRKIPLDASDEAIGRLAKVDEARLKLKNQVQWTKDDLKALGESV
jgi:hypothetical protein